ncbi:MULTISPECIES: hypothetical protein [unclassified Arthrobacter]|uniref:hypothetical protein n=1 Tax=unclassified Arthrobacter TaxID=235627 RepID=UPI0011AFE1B8|nr:MULTISPECIES: hypothetical protein [unclassified Arthrobacter]
MSMWQSRFLLIINEFSKSGINNVFTADENADKVDILFILYDLSNHQWIESDRLLELEISKARYRIDTIYVVGCGLTAGSGASDKSEVSKMVVSQTAHFSGTSLCELIVSPPGLDKPIYELFNARAGWSQLGRSSDFVHDEYSAVASELSTTNLNSFSQEIEDL